MTTHLTPAELDCMFQQQRKGMTPVDIHKSLVTKRGRRGKTAPDLTNVRNVLKGKTYKRGAKETRGLIQRQLLPLIQP